MLAENELYCGDCLEIMDFIDDHSIDLVLCDLPYGMSRCRWDSVIPFEPLWKQYKRIVKSNGAILLFAQTPFDKVLGCSNLPMLRYEWIWEKTMAGGFLNAKIMPLKAHENVLVFYDKLPTFNPIKTTGHKANPCRIRDAEKSNKSGKIYGKLKAGIDGGGGSTERFPRSVQTFSTDKSRLQNKMKVHPTQKPEALCEYLIRTYTNEGDLVLDNCAGSGTTGIACMNSGRNYLLIEKEEEYCTLAAERLANHTVKES